MDIARISQLVSQCEKHNKPNRSSQNILCVSEAEHLSDTQPPW